MGHMGPEAVQGFIEKARVCCYLISMPGVGVERRFCEGGQCPVFFDRCGTGR